MDLGWIRCLLKYLHKGQYHVVVHINLLHTCSVADQKDITRQYFYQKQYK